MVYIILFPILLSLLLVYIKRVPHGYVQWKTGLALKILPSLDDKPPIEMRATLEKLVAKRLPKIKNSLPVSKVRDIDIPTGYGSIKARYYDHGSMPGDPIIVYLHGGGFCLGSINLYEEVSRLLARTTKFKVITLEYSLSPEHKFPRAHNECLDASLWISQHHSDFGTNNSQLILAGDSAGGNIAISTVFALRKKKQDDIIACVVAVYPPVDGTDHKTPSNKAFATGYILTKQAMANFINAFVADKKDLTDPRLSVAFEKELSGFPPLFLLTAEFDPLRDEGEAFAARLKEAGNHVETKRYKGTVHAFFGLRMMGSQGIAAVEDVAAFVHSPAGRSKKYES